MLLDTNRVILVGTAGANAEVKHLERTTLVALRVKTVEKYTGKDGKPAESVDWHRVVCWGELADVAKAIRDGDKVSIDGRLKTRIFPAADGKKQYITEVVAKSVTVEPLRAERRDEAPPRSEDDIPF